MTIYKASIETRNFEFIAYSDTAFGAENTLKNTFIKHIKQYGGTYKWADVKSDVYVEEVTLNTGYVR